MAARGQFNTKSAGVKRILKEAAELVANPSPEYHAEPLEDDLFEWHFTICGPPEPSPYAGGIYHGRIVLPSQYPHKPPMFRFLTPTGRFEVNREICLSISGHHEETWQPAWGVRTALVAIRSFMDTDVKGQLGGIECDAKVRRRMAGESGAYKCAVCKKSNADIIRERKEAVEAVQGKEGGRTDETVPEELRLAYRDELGKNPTDDAEKPEPKGKETEQTAPTTSASSPQTASAPKVQSRDVPAAPVTLPALRPTRTVPAAPMQQIIQQSPDRSLAWIDAGIYGVVAALLFMVLRKFF